MPNIQVLQETFDNQLDFRAKWKSFEDWFEQHPALEALEPYGFDLLLAHYIGSENNNLPEDYFESEEWADIEDEMGDRGSEWLNLLVYLEDCKMNEIEPELDDFLHDFLLVEEDEFQDEHELYEPLIVLQGSIGAEADALIKACRAVESNELGPLLTVLLLFFNGEQGVPESLNALESALLAASQVAQEKGL
jgi:hypothetical protein